MHETPKTERWIAATLGLTMSILLGLASVTIYIDPLFHYHRPLEQYEYPLNNEDRYQNAGILRNFEYNGLIIGSSMVGEFKTSEAEALFNAPFVKAFFSSASYQEINDNLKRVYTTGNDIQVVIRSLDFDFRLMSKSYADLDAYIAEINRDYSAYYQFPEYLYNNNPFDDVNYILNKSILLKRTLWVLDFTQSGKKSTTFDEYGLIGQDGNPVSHTYGPEAVLKYTLPAPYRTAPMSEERRQMILQNIRRNVTDLADEHLETAFYLFFSPYSICYWDMQHTAGAIDMQIDTMEIAIEELLLHPNIHLYSFFTNFELICDLNNYRDSRHYGEWINSWILEQMHSGNYLLTEDNYRDHLDAMRQFYTSYDYASLHRQ